MVYQSHHAFPLQPEIHNFPPEQWQRGSDVECSR